MFPVRYELNFYILFRRNSVSKWLNGAVKTAGLFMYTAKPNSIRDLHADWSRGKYGGSNRPNCNFFCLIFVCWDLRWKEKRTLQWTVYFRRSSMNNLIIFNSLFFFTECIVLKTYRLCIIFKQINRVLYSKCQLLFKLSFAKYFVTTRTYYVTKTLKSK
jgi:hypothetical protein